MADDPNDLPEADLQPLSGLDALFLHLETPEMPMHVGGVNLYRVPLALQPRWLETVRRHIGARLHLIPAFGRRLASLPFDVANPVWVEDDAVDLAWHIRGAVLPAPGTPAQLDALVARLHAERMDRSRPLWELHVIAGLASGEVAIYTKLHHAAVDGAASAAVAAAVLDVTPEGRVVPPAPERAPVRAPGRRALLAAGLRTTVAQVRQLAGTLPEALRVGGRTAAGALSEAARRARTQAEARLRGGLAGAMWGGSGFEDGASGGDDPGAAEGGIAGGIFAPRTPLNGAIGRARGFAHLSLPLAPLKAAGAALDATLNDMVLALCATALRRWLDARGALPARPLVAAVPLSLRASGDTTHNNQVTMLVAELATDCDDPRERLARIRASMQRSKSLAGDFRDVIPTDFPSVGAPWVLGAFATFAGRTALADHVPPLANVVISNVVGAPVPLYLAGARMTHGWPASIVIHGVALNITVQSYDGLLEFGLTAAADRVPDVAELAALIEAAMGEYLALTSTGAPAGAPAAEPAAAAPSADDEPAAAAGHAPVPAPGRLRRPGKAAATAAASAPAVPPRAPRARRAAREVPPEPSTPPRTPRVRKAAKGVKDVEPPATRAGTRRARKAPHG